MTSPTGSNPVGRSAANSATESELDQGATASFDGAWTSSDTLPLLIGPADGRTGRSSVEGHDHLGRCHDRGTVDGSHGGANGQELDDVTSPEMRVLDELHADDSFATELACLFLHAGHR